MAGPRVFMRHIREILRQKWCLGWSHREVAAGLGVSLGVVSGTLARAREEGLDRATAEALGEAPAEPTALADRRAVQQILVSLLDNAIKYSEPEGTVVVEVREDADRVHVSVRDPGMGIPEQDLAWIFERFYRVDKARSRDLGGTGLGFSIVKHLAQAMGGHVHVESEEGVGSVFRFSLASSETPGPLAKFRDRGRFASLAWHSVAGAGHGPGGMAGAGWPRRGRIYVRRHTPGLRFVRQVDGYRIFRIQSSSEAP